MKRNLLNEEVDQIIAQSMWGKTGVKLDEGTTSIKESVEGDEAQDEVLEEGAHVCPLCESHLEEQITDEQLAEHVDLMVNIIDEVIAVNEELEAEEGDEINEEFGDEDEEEESDEESEDEDDEEDSKS